MWKWRNSSDYASPAWSPQYIAYGTWVVSRWSPGPRHIVTFFFVEIVIIIPIEYIYIYIYIHIISLFCICMQRSIWQRSVIYSIYFLCGCEIADNPVWYYRAHITYKAPVTDVSSGIPLIKYSKYRKFLAVPITYILVPVSTPISFSTAGGFTTNTNTSTYTTATTRSKYEQFWANRNVWAQ